MSAQRSSACRRILVVEDEAMVRMLLVDMVRELGHTVAGEAARLDEALQAASGCDFDLAILDVDLNGEPIAPVADALAARGTPFVLATGYGAHALPMAYHDRPILKKPFQITALKQALEECMTS